MRPIEPLPWRHRRHKTAPPELRRQAVDRVEAWLIRRALANNGGQKASTARRLGITREGLYN